MNKQKIALIVDANALIKQVPLRQVVNRSLTTDEQFNLMYEVYTLQEVINEIRDERARLFIQNLPYPMEIKNSVAISDLDQTIVDNFAKDTGDFSGLSTVDRQVIAFGVTLSRQKGEFEKVLKEPKSLAEFKPKSFKEFYDDDEELSWDSEEEEKQQPQQPKKDAFDDGFEVTTGGGRRGAKDREFQKYQQKLKQEESDQEAKEEVKEEVKEVEPEEAKEEAQKEESSDDDKFDDEEEGGEWVTAENLHKHISGGNTQNLLENLDNLLFANAPSTENPELN